MDPANGWYDAENDMVTISADIVAEVPQGVRSGTGQTPTGMALMEQLLEKQTGADVKFLVGTGDNKETFSAHKLVLSTSSSVFNAMFNFDNPPGDTVVPDVEPDTFRLMLRFIYTSKLDNLNGENVFPVLYAAKKYDINELRQACIDFDYGFDSKNALTILGLAHFYQEEVLVDRCFEFIDKNAKDVFGHLWEFPNLDRELLAELLSRDTLNIAEYYLFNMVKRWVIAMHAKDSHSAITKTNRRQIFDQMLGPSLLHKIRFPLISQDKFIHQIMPLELLTKDEVISVLLHHSGRVKKGSPSLLPFSAKKRAGTGNIVEE